MRDIPREKFSGNLNFKEVNLRKRIDYNAVNWKEIVYYDESSPTFLRWNISKAGKGCGKIKKDSIAGTVIKTGYMLITFKNTKYLIHRVIWILKHGTIDNDMFIDHIDGNPANNTIENLRLTTHSGNMQNRKPFKNNVSGAKGVYYLTNQDAFCVEWYDLEGKKRNKQFGCNRYGRDEAFSLACKFREKIIISLIMDGAGYTERSIL